jgi:hypothetical protein
MTDDEICSILLKYRILALEDSNYNNQTVWHEKLSENLTFISLKFDIIKFELIITNHHSIESLDNHVINKISYQYRLSNRLRQILIDDKLINNLEDKLKEMHMYITLKYL